MDQAQQQINYKEKKKGRGNLDLKNTSKFKNEITVSRNVLLGDKINMKK